MHVISPLNTLRHGYSITTDHQAEVISDNYQLKIGQLVITHFAEGRMISRVESTSSDNLISDITDKTQKDM